jgi:autotransporter family porin
VQTVHRSAVVSRGLLFLLFLLVVTVVSACSSSHNITVPLPASTTTVPTTASPTPTTGAETKAAGRPADPTTLPPGSALPSDSDCAARVVPAPEVRPTNARYNATRGHQKNIPKKWLDRVTGDFSGTTDEILQWAACKWGIDPNVVRAQAAKESWWHMSTVGDYGTDPKACPPGHDLGVDGTPGQCPQSYGILQVRYPYHGPPAGNETWPEAEQSTAYNVDYTYSVWRACYEGDYTWLNTVDRGGTYAAGDLWGCVGMWFSGRWHTDAANGYIDAVRGYYDSQVWKDASFTATP